MEKRVFGLIGYPLTQSFSRAYFLEKFRRIDCSADYLNFEIDRIALIEEVLLHSPKLCGLNVTIPYKVTVLPFLSRLNDAAIAIGAVNTIKISNNEKVGYNTDYIGFQKSLQPILQLWHTKALVLGSGGAAAAVKYALQMMGVEYVEVSRDPAKHQLGYSDISKEMLDVYSIIINTTPLGMFPSIASAPDIPYQYLNKKHLLFDLVYNPEETLFLKKGKQQGAMIKNGLEMLHLQAEAAWEIWNE